MLKHLFPVIVSQRRKREVSVIPAPRQPRGAAEPSARPAPGRAAKAGIQFFQLLLVIFFFLFAFLARPCFAYTYSKVNPNAGDFLWELEGKPAPKYTWHERDTNAVTQPVSFPRKRESME